MDHQSHIPDDSAPMDARTKRAAVAICDRERGPVVDSNRHCKTCRNARYVYNPETKEDDFNDQGERCPGLGYRYLAEVALNAADTK